MRTGVRGGGTTTASANWSSGGCGPRPALPSGSGRGPVRGRAPSGTCSSCRPASPAGSAASASGPATWSRFSCRTGSRAPPPGSRAACSVRPSSRSSTTTAPASSPTSSGNPRTVLVIAERFGSVDHLANLEAVRPGLDTLEHVVVVGDTRPASSTRFADLLDGDRLATSVTVDPASPTVVAYTSGTSANPKGVIQSHRSLGAEVRTHMSLLIPPGRRPELLGAPISHATGMLLGLLLPASRGAPIHLIDAWDPTVVLDAMLTDDLSRRAAARRCSSPACSDIRRSPTTTARR